MSGGIDFPGYGAAPVTTALPVNAFDAATKAWKEVSGDATDVPARQLTFATFNTWFQGGEKELRHAALLDCLRETHADVIFLQEVTIQLLDKLLAAAFVRDRYRWSRSPFRVDSIPSHGLVLLARLPYAKATLHPLRSNMGRRLLTAEACVNGHPLTLATVHLESLKPNADTRGEQLRAIFRLLDGAADSVLAGDFNFCSSWKAENDLLDARYVDAWPAARPSEPGYTEDTDVNLMLADSKREARHVRFDRILVRSDDIRWKVRSVELLGTGPVDNRHARVFPSDHFGLAATLS